MEKIRNKGVPLFQLFEGKVCDTLFDTIYALPPPPPPPPPPDERLAVACIRLLLVPQLLPPLITPTISLGRPQIGQTNPYRDGDR